VLLSPRRGVWLKKQMAERGGAFKVKVDIDASFQEQGEQAMVEAWIRGSEIRDQQVVLTAHLQENTSANDDGSGCVNLLEMGGALTRLIREGKIQRPRRDIRFWWVNEFASQERFFRENPTEPRKMLVNVNQDMVGARQSFGGRVQYGSRLPWSLPHALDDVMESVLTLVRDGNTSLLTTRGTRAPQPYTREILAVKGSREPYHARMVPYYDSTDHHAFTPARIGVPGTSLTNWPDEFIHSTGDDLENIDATQLERNAVVATAVALYFASAGEAEAPALAAFVAARGRARLAADAARAVELLARAAPTEQAGAFRDARNLLVQSQRKESAALASVRRLSPKGRAAGHRRPGARAPGERGGAGAGRAREGVRGDRRQDSAEHRADARRAPDDGESVRARAGHRRLRGRDGEGQAGPGSARHDALRRAGDPGARGQGRCVYSDAGAVTADASRPISAAGSAAPVRGQC
jgi:hypothetical protein